MISRILAAGRSRPSPRPRVVDMGGRPPPWARPRPRVALRATERASGRSAGAAPHATTVAPTQLRNATTVARRPA